MKITQELIDRTKADLELVNRKIAAAALEAEEARKAIDRRTLLGEDVSEPAARAQSMEAMRTKLEADASRLETEVRRLEAGLAAQEARTLLDAWTRPSRALGDAASKAAAAVHELVEVARALSWPTSPAGVLDTAIRSSNSASVLLELVKPDGPSWIAELGYWPKLDALLAELARVAGKIPEGPAARVRDAEARAARAEGGAG